MASPTTNKGYTYPAHNGSINTWDTPIDADFDQIDLNFGGCYNVTGSSSVATVTFNASQCIAASTANLVTFPTSIAQNMYYKVSGAFNSSCVLVFPAVGSFYVIRNTTSSGSIYAGISGNTANGVAVGTANPVMVVADSSNMFNTDPTAAAEFASGTGLIFAMAAPPANWTADYTGSGRALILSGGVGTNGATGGSWVITGLNISVGAHTLTTAELASHNHSYTAPNGSQSVANGGNSAVQSTSGNNTGSAGSNNAHTHTGAGSGDGSWRPLYYQPFRATKN